MKYFSSGILPVVYDRWKNQLGCTRHPFVPLQWRHIWRDGASNHQPHHCLLNRLFRHKSKKTSKLRATGLCAENSPVPGEFPAQMASIAEISSFDYVIMHSKFINQTRIKKFNYFTVSLDQNDALRWRHNGHDSVSNHQPHDCFLNRSFRRRSKKASKLRVTGLCAGNSPRTGEFPAHMASNAENVSISWRHYSLSRLVFFIASCMENCIAIECFFRTLLWQKGSVLKSIKCLIHPTGHILQQRLVYTCLVSLMELLHYFAWSEKNLFNQKASSKSMVMKGKALAFMRITEYTKYLFLQSKIFVIRKTN